MSSQKSSSETVQTFLGFGFLGSVEPGAVTGLTKFRIAFATSGLPRAIWSCANALLRVLKLFGRYVWA